MAQDRSATLAPTLRPLLALAKKNYPMPRQRTLARIHRILCRRFGTPRQPHPAREPLDCLIRTILSQNTSDVNSTRAWTSLRKRFPRWDDVLAAPPAALTAAIRSGGLARQKSRRIRSILQWTRHRFGRLTLRTLHNMTDDQVRTTLAALPGVGPKTIHVLLAFALSRDALPVDTHVHRITTRLGLLPPRCTPERAHAHLAPLVPHGAAYALHANLLQLGRLLCRPQRPRCPECPLLPLCPEAARRT